MPGPPLRLAPALLGVLVLISWGCPAPPPPRPRPRVAEPGVKELAHKAYALFGPLPDLASSKKNPASPAKVALGRALFHDPRLSPRGVSCSPCHGLGAGYGARPQAPAEGAEEGAAKPRRDAPSVLNAALQFAQYWDGRAFTLQAQAREAFLNPAELGLSSEAELKERLQGVGSYLPLFQAAFPEAQEPLSF